MNEIAQNKLSKREVMVRGARGVCPCCAEAPLFRAYLKPVDQCASCGMAWSDVRADDAPAWATILIVGHLLVPFFHIIGFDNDLPGWAPGLILAGIGSILSLIVLPRAKGAFMGLIWVTGAPTS